MDRLALIILAVIVVAGIAAVGFYQQGILPLGYANYPVNCDVIVPGKYVGLTKVERGWYVTVEASQISGFRVLNSNAAVPETITVTLTTPSGATHQLTNPDVSYTLATTYAMEFLFDTPIPAEPGIYYVTINQTGNVPETQTNFWFEIASTTPTPTPTETTTPTTTTWTPTATPTTTTTTRTITQTTTTTWTITQTITATPTQTIQTPALTPTSILLAFLILLILGGAIYWWQTKKQGEE